MMGTTTGKSCMSRASSVPAAYRGADSYNHNRLWESLILYFIHVGHARIEGQ